MAVKVVRKSALTSNVIDMKMKPMLKMNTCWARQQRWVWLWVFGVSMLMCMTAAAPAQEGDAPPEAAPQTTTGDAAAEAPAEVIELVATVAEVRGTVTVKRAVNENAAEPAKVGMQLRAGDEFRTLFKSYIRLTLPPAQIVVLDRMGSGRIIAATRQGNKITVALGMNRGRMRYDLEAAGLEHDASITSPNTTLAMRGTDGQLQDGDGYPPSVMSRRGKVIATFEGFLAVPLGGVSKAEVNRNRRQPAVKARQDTRIDPSTAFSGKTAIEDDLIEQYPELGGFNAALLEQLASSLGVTSDFAFVGTIPITGQLIVNAFWNGTPNVNVDLSIRTPTGDVLSKDNPQVFDGGFGQHAGDGFADQLGQNGNEAGTWIGTHATFPGGKYNLKVDLVTPGGFATGAIVVLRDNQLVENLPFVLNVGIPSFSQDIDVQP